MRAWGEISRSVLTLALASGCIGAAEPTCIRRLAVAPLPPTWDEITAQAEIWCWTTSRCESDVDAALTIGWDECEGFIRGYYDASGDLVAVQDVNDTNTCRPNVFEYWYGEVVDTCVAIETVDSPGCARPWSPPRVDRSQHVEATGEPWTDAQARLAAICHGMRPCSLPSGRQVVTTYIHNLCEGGQGGRFDVYDLATGHVGGGLDTLGVGVPDLDVADAGALADCLAEFTPSDACGVASAP